MTVAVPLNRALSAKFASRTFQVVTRFGCKPWQTRADRRNENGFCPTSARLTPQWDRISALTSRSYATSTSPRPVGRPKAHTGRTPARRTTKTTTPKKPGPKTAEGKKNVGRKPKADASPKPKKTAKKAVKKAEKKAPSKTAVAEKRRTRERELKAQALLDTPKALPSTPWHILFTETNQNQPAASLVECQNRTKEAAQKLKDFTPEQKEHYNHESHLAKEKNDQAYKRWLNQYSPEQIRDANNARNQLKRMYKEKYPNSKHTNKYPPLKDDRLVKRPMTQYGQFTKDRHASGDFARMTIAESAKLIAKEWKALSDTDKKKYADMYQGEHNRYIEEHKSVYGREPGVRKEKAT